jgi:hypothetical protein
VADTDPGSSPDLAGYDGEIGRGGVELLVDNGLLKQHQADDRHAVGAACLAALEQWAEGRGARSMGQG